MTDSNDTTITIADDFSWPRQDREVTIALDPETGRVYDIALVGPGTPEEVYRRRHLALVHPDAAHSPESVVSWLEAHVDTLQQILDGYEGVEFDGHSRVGRWSEEATDAVEGLRAIFASAGDAVAHRWDADDFLAPVSSDIVDAVRAAGGDVDVVTDSELAAAVINGAVLDRDELREVIQRLWDDREDSDDDEPDPGTGDGGLVARRNAHGYHVVDPAGGVWWPDEDATAEIEGSSDPEAAALRVCAEEPMRGSWLS